MGPSPRQLKQRCPCGSGKAFKNCHGQEFLAPRRATTPRYPTDEDPFLAAPGYTDLTFTFQHEGEDRPRSPVGEPGEYEATFTLLPPGRAAEKPKGSGMSQTTEVPNEKIAGDSHLALCLPEAVRPSPNAEIGLAVTIRVNRPDRSGEGPEITLLPNDSGRLSKVVVRTHAEDFADAERRAYYEASALLSDLAFKLDIPLRIAHKHIKEVKTLHTKIGFVRQFGYRGIANLPGYGQGDNGLVLGTEPEPYPALSSVYREALNSESPFYQFLCFCRVIQRLKEVLRPRWEKTIVGLGKGLMPTYRKHERLPEEGEEAEHVPEPARGKKFYRVYDDHLRPLRNGIGHIFLEDMTDETSPERSTDEYEFVSEVYVYLPVAHRIARTMLENDFGANGMARLALRLQAQNAATKTTRARIQ